MKIGILILCRMSSERFPGKVLHQICGRSVIGHIYDRIRILDSDINIVVCTSDDKSDDEIEYFCRMANIKCFRGSLDNVAARFLSCARSLDLDFAVRINGDNIFCDPYLISEAIAVTKTNFYDLVTNVPNRTFPVGMSVEIIRINFFEDVIQRFTESDLEHVTSFFYNHPTLGSRYYIENNRYPALNGLDLALDDPDDLHGTVKLMERLFIDQGCSVSESLNKHFENNKFKDNWNGKNNRPLLIAEIGGNHEGSFKDAMKLVDDAIAADVDAVKFQLYRGDTIANKKVDPERNLHFKKFELSREEHINIAEYVTSRGVKYMASIWDLEMLDWVDGFIDIYKIGSGDLTAWPLIREFAKRGKPIICSTGLSTMDEILATVEFIQNNNPIYTSGKNLCLMQCTSMYPIADSDANLRIMTALKAKTGLAVGYSDHTQDKVALFNAITAGAEVLEFHFSNEQLKGTRSFRDHKVSLTEEEVKELIDKIESYRTQLGTFTKVPQQSEIDSGHVTSFRRAVYAANSIKKGDRIEDDDLVVLRPNVGTDAREYDSLIGAVATCDIEPLSKIKRGVNIE